MVRNLFFLCGPHGSGKTTLGNGLSRLNPNIVSPEFEKRGALYDCSPSYRNVSKAHQRATENWEYIKMAEKYLDKIVLGNRCIYDSIAYNEVYAAMGWISGKDKDETFGLIKLIFIDGIANPLAIVLNPGFDIVKEHLKKRWEKAGKKWREENLEYARQACLAYEQFRANPNVLYIDREIDMKIDVKKVNDWVLDKFRA